VYIRLTRGQDALVVEHHDESGVRTDLPQVDLTAFQLPVLAAAPEELQAHEAALTELDKACGGKSIWRPAAVA
jgi:DNA polymerase-3 subunit epsilon